MINLFIDYLLNQPTPTTAPLTVALQTPALLTQLGGSGVTVNLVDTRDYEGNPPFVRVYDSGIKRMEAQFLGGSYQELQFLNIECSAYGSTSTEASKRADDLKRAVRGVIQTQITNFFISGLDTRTDSAGSNATDSISSINPVGGDGDPVVKGPGKDSTDPKWTAQVGFKVQVRVFYQKATVV